MQNRKRHVLFTFILVALWLTASADTQKVVSGDSSVFRDYYSLLSHISKEPYDRQIEALESFIAKHPRFERPYHQLLSVALLADKLEDIEKYFKANLTSESTYRNSLWALSKISVTRDSSETALRRLEFILKESIPTPYLLMEFAHHHSYKDVKTFRNELDSLGIRNVDRHIALSFYYSQKRNHASLHHIKHGTDNPAYELYAQSLLGYSCFSQNNLQAADSVFRAGMARAKALGDKQFEIHFHVMLAGAYLKLHSLRTAEHFCQTAISQATAINDLERLAHARQLYCQILAQKGKFEDALEQIEKVRTIYDTLHRPSQLAQTCLQMGHIYVQMLQYSKALDLYEQAIEMARSRCDKNTLMAAYQKKGGLFMRLNLYYLADQEFDKAIQLADSTIDPFIFDLTTIERAEQLYELGYLERSESLLLKVLASKDIDPALLVFAHFYLATCYEIALDFDNALATYSRVSDIVEQYPDMNRADYYKALSFPQRAAIEARIGNFENAHKLLSDSLLHYRMATDPNMNFDFHIASARVAAFQGNYAKAIYHYEKAVELNEQRLTEFSVEMFRIGHFKQTSEQYQDLINCYYIQHSRESSQDLAESIYNTVQLTSGRTLQNIATLKKKNAFSETYTMIRDSLQYLQRRLRDSVWKNDDAMTAELRILHDISRNALLNHQLQIIDPVTSADDGFVSLEKLQTICRQHDTDVILFNISDTLAFSLIVQPDTLAVVALDIARDVLEHKIQKLLSPLHDAAPENLHAVKFHANTAYELYDHLFRPITDRFDLSENLFIIPGITLLNVPFEMFLTKPQPRSVYTTQDSADYSADFLQHQYTFTYSPSLTPLLNRKSSSDSKSLVIFSNPRFYDLKMIASLADLRSDFRSIFSQLPYSELEGEAIEAVYPATHRRNDKVTKKKVLNGLRNFDIVHIATHAFVDSIFESFSGLALATENDRDDGLLMGYELHGETFDNDLIVLSACESGAGQFIAGEGVLGLPRLLLRTGAKSVLMSLWKVHDAFPVELMPTFYDHYLNQGANKAQALAMAKRHVLNHAQMRQYNHKHPFFWATFCLYGSPGPGAADASNVQYAAVMGTVVLIIIILVLWRRFRRSTSTFSSRL